MNIAYDYVSSNSCKYKQNKKMRIIHLVVVVSPSYRQPQCCLQKLNYVLQLCITIMYVTIIMFAKYGDNAIRM